MLRCITKAVKRLKSEVVQRTASAGTVHPRPTAVAVRGTGTAGAVHPRLIVVTSEAHREVGLAGLLQLEDNKRTPKCGGEEWPLKVKGEETSGNEGAVSSPELMSQPLLQQVVKIEPSSDKPVSEVAECPIRTVAVTTRTTTTVYDLTFVPHNDEVLFRRFWFEIFFCRIYFKLSRLENVNVIKHHFAKFGEIVNNHSNFPELQILQGYTSGRAKSHMKNKPLFDYRA